jgi:hypothetical protein
VSSTRQRRWLAIGASHEGPLQLTREQKLKQKHSQKMGRGSIFWSARFVGREASIRRTGRLQRRRVLYALKDRDFGGRTHRTRAGRAARFAALPMSVDGEPWRERPPSCARCLTPGAPQEGRSRHGCQVSGAQMRPAVSPSSSAQLPHIVTERSADDLGEMQSQIHHAFTRSFPQPFTPHGP